MKDALAFYLWTTYKEPHLTPEQKVEAYETFAAEYDQCGWREMAACCRRLAGQHRVKGVAPTEIVPGRGSVPGDGYSEAASTTRPRRVRRQGRGAGVD